MNKYAKTSTIFIAIIAILLISLAAIAIFFFKKEVEQRQIVELNLQKATAQASQLTTDLASAKKQIFVGEQKAKESEEKINSLLDELDLQEGIREEIKAENKELKDSLAKGKQEQDQAIADKLKLGEKITELENQLKIQLAQVDDLKAEKDKFEKMVTDLKDKVSMVNRDYKLDYDEPDQLSADVNIEEKKAIDLEKIVVMPEDSTQGRILSVDTETNFVIFNLGEKDGMKIGEIVSVFRGDEYLGDVKVSRVHSEMSAADFIPPFSSRRVRKNDQVVIKQ